MKIFSNLQARLRAAFHPDQVHSDISDELRFHIEMKTADLIRKGMPEEEARRQAERAFGSTARLSEQGWDVRGHNQLEQLAADIRFAGRLLRKSPFKTAVLIATLALGIGLNTALFGVVRSVLLQPLPFRDADRLVVLHQSNHGAPSGVSYPHFLDWRSGNHAFQDMAVYTATSATLTGHGDPVRISGAIVSGSLFRVLAVTPLRGRLLKDEEDRIVSGPQSIRPLLITDRLWRSKFEDRSDILGQLVHLDGADFTIVGIIAAPLAFPMQKDAVDYWTTVAVDADPTRYGGSIPTSRGYPRYDGAIARLKPGVTLSQASAGMTLLATNIARLHPKSTSANQVAVVSVLQDVIGAPSRTMILLLYGAVFCVLLVACVNVANLLLVDAMGRRREFSLRSALGAPVAKLVRQVLVESVIIALAGGAASFLIAAAVLGLFVAFAPPDTPRLSEIHLDASAFFYVLLVSIVSGLLFGCLPALSTRKHDLAKSLKEGSWSVSRKSGILQPGPLLISIQIALSMVLICSAFLLITSFERILHSPRGFNPNGVLTASISLPVSSYGQNSTRVAGFYQAFLRDLRAIPGVQSATASEVLPLSGDANSTTVEIGGVPDTGLRSADLRFVEPAYFATLQIPLFGGRFFTDLDTPGHPPAAIVNQAFVRRFLQAQDPYHAELKLGWGGGRKRIVGIVGDVRPTATSAATEPEVYVPFAQFPLNDMSILVRSTGNPETLANALRKVARQLDAALPVDRIRSLDDYLLLSSAPQQFLMWLLVAFAITTLLLAAVGIYGVLSNTTASRTQEFGIRLALGASRWGVVRLVLRQGLSVALAGLVVGAGLTVFTSRLMTRWLFDANTLRPEIFFASSGILLIVVVAACSIPSRRAASTDPSSALRMG